MQILKMSLTLSTQPQPKHLSFTKSSLFHFSLPTTTLSLSPKPLTICMGGGPRTFPGGVSKWQWKRMQAKKAKQLLKARLARERQIYEMRKRAELKSAVAQLERPWEPIVDDESVAKTTTATLFSVSADEQVKVLADRFRKPGGFDLWTDNDGPQLFRSNGIGSEGNSRIGFSMRGDNDVKFSRERSGNGRRVGLSGVGSEEGVGLSGVGSEEGVGFRGKGGEKDEVVNGESKGRETSRFINGSRKGRGKSLVKYSGGSEQRLDSWVRDSGSGRRVGSQVSFNGGSGRRVGSQVSFNGGTERRVGSQVSNGDIERKRVGSRANFNGGSERRVESRFSNGGSERRVGSKVRFNNGNEQRVQTQVRNGGSEQRVGSWVNVNGGSERRVQSEVRNGGSERRLGIRVGSERRVRSRVGSERRVGSRVRFNYGNERRVQSQVRNGGSRKYEKNSAFKRTDYSESEAYEMSLEQDGSYGHQAESGEGKASF